MVKKKRFENESFKWIKRLRDILDEILFSFLRKNLQNIPNYLPSIYQTVKDQASQNLKIQIRQSVHFIDTLKT